MEQSNRYFSISQELQNNIDLKNIDLNSINDDVLAFDNYIIIDQKLIFTTSLKVVLPLIESFSEILYEDSFDEEIIKLLSTLPERSVDVLKLHLLNGMTFADIGKILNITRERVRQVEEQAIRKLVFGGEFFKKINDFAEKNPIFFLKNIPINDMDLKRLVCLILSHKNASGRWTYIDELGFITKDTNYSYDKIKLQLFDFIREIGENIYSYEELESYVSFILPLFDSKFLIDKLLAENEISVVNSNMYFFHSFYKSKREKVEFIYSRYPEGFETTKQIENLKEDLEYFFPGVFIQDKDKAISTLAFMSENIFLWEWGKHIHIKFIEDILDNYDFSDLLQYIDQELDNILAVDLDTYYNKNMMGLQLFGIPSKYALHTLVKLKYPDDYSFQDSPRIASIGTKRLESRQILIDAMSESRIYKLDELMQTLNTPKDRIQQLIERLDDVIVVDTCAYLKIEHINLDNILLSNIIQFVNEQVEAFKFIYIGLVIDHFREQLHSIALYNKETTLLQLLQKYRGKKDFNVSNTRIVSKDYPITRQSLNFHYLLEQLMVNKKQISKNEIFNYFVVRGLDPRLVMAYYHYSKLRSIIRIDDDTFIKMETFEIDHEIILAVTHLIEKHIKGEHHLDDLLKILNTEITFKEIIWNRFIICDILDKSLFRFTPSSDNPLYVEYKRSFDE